MPHHYLRGLFLSGCLAASTTGCGAKGGPLPPTGDLSKPKPAALAFLNAIASGDARAARGASIGTEEDKKWIDAMTGLINGLRDYDQALVSRYGQAAVRADVELKQVIQSMAQDPVMKFDGSTVKEAEDTAEIRAALNGMRLTAEPPILMKKEKGLWKVDLSAMRQDPRHDPAVVEQYALAGKALRQATQAIRSGRYKTIEEAQQGIEQLPVR